MTAKTKGYKSETQQKNLMWMLPRPHPSHYKGGFPLHVERWLIELAEDILGRQIDNKEDLMNVFAGMTEHGFRVDVSPEVKPDLVADTQELSKYLDPMTHQYYVIISDPPYSDLESLQLYHRKEHLNYKKWTGEVAKYLRPGGLLIVYHKNLPRNPNPDEFVVVKRVAIANRVGHGVRICVYFQKKTKTA